MKQNKLCQLCYVVKFIRMVLWLWSVSATVSDQDGIGIRHRQASVLASELHLYYIRPNQTCTILYRARLASASASASVSVLDIGGEKVFLRNFTKTIDKCELLCYYIYVTKAKGKGKRYVKGNQEVGRYSPAARRSLKTVVRQSRVAQGHSHSLFFIPNALKSILRCAQHLGRVSVRIRYYRAM